MAKKALMINSLLVMMTGMTLEEVADICVKEGEQAMQEAMFKGAEQKRRENDLMSPENMLRKPKEEENGKA